MDPKHPHSTMDPKRNAALNTARTNMEMAQGISRGVPPSNPQIATVLEGTERALNSATLPPESQKVGHDAAVLVGDMKTVFLEKNKDENLQGLIKDMSALAGASAHQVSAKAGPGGVGGLATRAKGLIRGQEAQGSMQQGMESVKQLVRALVRNDEFRSGLKELFSTLQWAFYQRSKDVRANVDQHWGSDQFYTYYSTPAFAAPAAPFASAFPVVGTTGTTMGTIPATSTLPVVTPIATIAQPVQPAIIHKAPDPMLPHPPRQPTTDFERKLANLTPMTNAERMELRGRLLTSLLKLNRTQELRNAMTNFVQLITWIKSQSLLAGSGSGSSASAMAKTVLPSTGPGIVKPATTHTTQQTTMTPLAKTTTTTTTTTGAPIVHTAPTPTFKSVMKRFQRLVEEFSGAKSLDDLVFYTKEFFVMMKNDENLRNIMSESANWGHDFFKSGYTTQEAIPVAQMQQLDALIQRIDHTFVGLANHYVIWRLLEEIQQVTTAIKNDPFRQKLALDTKVLVEDFLYYDQMGRPQLNTQVISQLKFLILPILREQMAFIPLPRIEGSDEKMDYWIENVVLTTSDILPDNVKVDVRSKSLLNRPGLTGNMKNLIRLTLDNVRVHLKDVRFWYRKKTFPKMTDEGFVDFYLTRNGLRVTLELLTDFAAERDIFFVNKVKVNADRLKVKIHESKHDFLYSILLGLFSGRMKREIEFKTEEAIRNNFAKINTSLSRIVHAVGERRSAATGVLGAKTSGPIASALDTFVHPSVTRPSVTH